MKIKTAGSFLSQELCAITDTCLTGQAVIQINEGGTVIISFENDTHRFEMGMLRDGGAYFTNYHNCTGG